MATVTKENLSAWLVRCNPEVFDLRGFVEEYSWVFNWSVAHNYRSKMMEPGNRILLWVTGNGKIMPRGIWGLGYVTGFVQGEPPDDPDARDVSYWLDEDRRLSVTHSIDVYIPLLDFPVTDADLKAAGIDDLEVQRQPQGSNPSWISREQMHRLSGFLPDWPKLQSTVEDVTVAQQGGAGFGDAVTNQVVEAAAMAAARTYYESRDWTVEDVSMDFVGWDLTCTSPAGQAALVEVKGVRGDRPTVLLTANEIRAAREDDGWVLSVVTNALSDPQVHQYNAAAAVEAAQPWVYRAALSHREPTPAIRSH